MDRVAEIKRRIDELHKEFTKLRMELLALSGDLVPDFNDVWGGAGPDCVMGFVTARG